MQYSSATHEAPRATGTDWGKAFLCSAALLLVLLLFFFLVPGSRSVGTLATDSSGEGGGNDTGAGGSGGTAGSGIGPGEGSGTGETGDGPGAGTTGEGRGEAASAPVSTPGITSSDVNVTEEALNDAPASSTPVEPVPPLPEPAAAPTEVDDPAAAPPPPPVEEKLALLSISAPAANSVASPPAAPGASGASGGASAGKNVGGMFVKGGSLGVILDVSGSMTSYLESLRQEISTQFANAVFLEVNGCDLSPLHDTDLDPGAVNVGPKRSSVMEAVRELVEVNNVDSIYWFCDLQDYRSEEALQQLSELIAGRTIPRATAGATTNNEFPGLDELKRMNQNSRRPVGRPAFHLYIRSVGQSPDPALDIIIRESGGSFQLKR